MTAFYCPLTPSGGLRFDYETEATPLVQSSDYGRSGTPREMDWTQVQHLQRGWVSARVPAHFHLRKSETRRERLQVVNDKGKLSVVNGLGATMKSLWLADASGKIYQAVNIAAGQKSELLPSVQSQVSERKGASSLLQDIGFTAQPDSLKENVGKYLEPGTYIAELEGNPFIENALNSSSPKRTRINGIVFGILDSPVTP